MVKKMVNSKDAESLDFNELQPPRNNDIIGFYHDAKAICVVLDKDTKKSELEATMAAIAQLKGVMVVKFIDLDMLHDYPNRVRAKIEIRKQIGKLLDY